MYERADILQFVKMLERGLFSRSQNFVDVKTFALKDWEIGLKTAEEDTGIGKCAVFVPAT
mgnify:CR=1 FL=1